MFLRIFSAFVMPLMLAGCGSIAEALPGDVIDCAIGAGADFSSVCAVEQAEGQGSGKLLLHHPGGGFRRFEFDADTMEILAADGADPVFMAPFDGEHLVFSVGADQYRIPIDLVVDPQ